MLCINALGKERVWCYSLPCDLHGLEDYYKTVVVAKTMGVDLPVINLVDAVHEAHGILYPHRSKVSVGNIKARMRMMSLYSKAEWHDALVVGTGNRTELLIGYFTKYGDGGVDFLPIGHLYKTQVRLLARELNIPEAIIQKPPSAGLWEGQTDEGELGITYEALDRLLIASVDMGKSEEDIVEMMKTVHPVGYSELSNIKTVMSRVKTNAHKLSMPPTFSEPFIKGKDGGDK